MSYRRHTGQYTKQQGDDQRDFDTTSLRATGMGRVVHRDYAAHFFRWGFARRMIKGGSRVLDIGCGPDQALVRELSYQPSLCPRELVMVEYGKITKPLRAKWAVLHDEFDFTKRWRELDGPFDVITCLEVIEHMQKAHGRKLLKGARELMGPKSTFLLSTPVFSPKVGMARNHIHEYGIDELRQEIERAGLVIEQRFGTFMNAQEAKKTRPEHRAVWEALSTYYSSDVLACFLAPLYPDQARNNLWVLRRD